MCKKFLGKHLVIKLVPQKSKTGPKTEYDQKKNKTKAMQAVFNHPFVVKAQKMFDGEIINY
jgi:hypothetical protein